MRMVWPFPTGIEVIEVLDWATDVLRAKSAEQRICMRAVPRRTFQLSHLLSDYERTHADALIREAQGGDGFWVPDWPQSINVGVVSVGSSVATGADLSSTDMGDKALLWESVSLFEAVDISAGVMATVTQSYRNAKLVPLWEADAPDGLGLQRIGANLNNVLIAMITDSGEDLTVVPATTYRNLDVLDDCPIIGGGSLEESTLWPVTAFGNTTTLSHYLRQRSIPNADYTMRWHLFDKEDQYALRRWLHYRRGRQKAFWMSSRCKDMEPAASYTSSGSLILRVFSFPGLTGIGRDEAFDIQIKTTGYSAGTYNRRITALAVGAPISGRPTLELTMNTSLGVTVSINAMIRISFLRCSRLDSDRVELLHRAGEGMAVTVPVIEIHEP